MKTLLKSFAAALLAIVVLISASSTAEASRASMTRSITTGGTLALKGWGYVTFKDNNEVSDVDLYVRDYKCDGRGGSTRVEFKIRELGGVWTGWVRSSWVNSAGCGQTASVLNRTYPLVPVSKVYSARLRVCFDNAGCFYSGEVRNPYA